MKLDENTINELYYMGILKKSDIRKLNIINCYQATGSISISARKAGVSRQYAFTVLSRKRKVDK